MNWCLGTTCNYACSYCPVSLHDGSAKWHSLANVKAFVLRVKQFHPDKKIYFEFTGGEVTLNKDFIAICQFCHTQDVSVGLLSNGGRTLRWWQANKLNFDHVNLSFHVEYADPDHFCAVADILCRDVATHVNVMMHPERFDECVAVAQRLKQYENVTIALQPLLHDLHDELYDYTADQLTVLAQQRYLFQTRKTRRFPTYRGNMRGSKEGVAIGWFPPNHFLDHETNNWFGWECWTGVEQVVVNHDGTIWRGWCQVGGLIGHISDPDLALPSAPVVCDKSRCHCNLDIMTTKIRLPNGV